MTVAESLVLEKAISGERLTFEEGLALFEEPDVDALCHAANTLREQRVGDTVYFCSTLYL